jgi:murein DD-endopeptidase MepM/ murein hydrolase activator NlpD
LYVKRGSLPTTSSYDYRPYLDGNNETVTINNPLSGDWYIMLQGYSAYAGLTLVATFSGTSSGSITTLVNNTPVAGVSGSQGSQRFYRIAVPTGQARLEIKISGGTGDCDLYVKRGSLPTTSSYDYRPYLGGNNETVTINNPLSGDWYIMLQGYSAYSGLTLVATFSGSGYAFKLPLPGNHQWRCTQGTGIGDHTNDKNKFYSLDFSWRTFNSTWPSNLNGPLQDIPLYAMHSGKVIDGFYGPPNTATYGAIWGGFPANGYFLRIDKDLDGNMNTGLVTVYIHLKYPPAKSIGTIINAGDFLGYMGTTGDSTGVHVHFTMRYNGDSTYGLGGAGQVELEKVLIEGIKLRSFQSNGYYLSTR